MNVCLHSGYIGAAPLPDSPLPALGVDCLEKEALLVYNGVFDSAEGEVTVKVEDILRTHDRHNLRVASLMAECGGEILAKDCPPIQLDHSPLATNTIGRLWGPIRMADILVKGFPRKALFGRVRILGKENVEKVADGRWVHGSIGADFAEGKINEWTITPFPAAENAAMLSKLGSVELPGKVDEALWDKAKKQVEKEYGEIRWPVVTKVYEDMGGTFHKESKMSEVEQYNLINSQNDIAKTIKANSLEDAAKKAREILKSDGSYDFKEVQDPKTRKRIRLSKESPMDKEKLKAHLMEKHKLSAEDADNKLAGMTDDDQTSMAAEIEQKEKLAAESEEKELRAKCRKHLTGDCKMSEKDADEKLSKMSKEEMSKLSADADEEEKKKLAAEKDEKEKEEKDKLSKLASAKKSVIELAKSVRSHKAEETVELRKATIGTRLSKLRSEGKLTPAEQKEISIEKLSARSDEALEAYFEGFETRQPQVMVGQYGSTNAEKIARLSKSHTQEKLFEETRANMPFTGSRLKAAEGKKSTRLSSAAMLSEKKDEEPEVELEAYYGSVCKMMEAGDKEGAFNHLREFMSRSFAKKMAGEMEADRDKRLSALAERNKTLQNQIEELVTMVSPLLGIDSEELKA